MAGVGGNNFDPWARTGAEKYAAPNQQRACCGASGKCEVDTGRSDFAVNGIDMLEEEQDCYNTDCKLCQCSRCKNRGILSRCGHCNDMAGPMLFDDCAEFTKEEFNETTT